MKKRSLPTAAPGLALALALLVTPLPDPAPAAVQEEEAPPAKVEVLAPLPEEPAEAPPARELEQSVLDQRLVEPPAAVGPLAAVRLWAEAWSSQDVERYLSFYAQSFTPADGRSREEWAAERRQRLSEPDFIEIGVDFDEEAAPKPVAGGGVVVTFRQSYTSDRYFDVVQKTLELVREDGVWKIAREVVAD